VFKWMMVMPQNHMDEGLEARVEKLRQEYGELLNDKVLYRI